MCWGWVMACGERKRRNRCGNQSGCALVFTFFRFFSVRARLGAELFLAVGDEVLADLDGVEGGAFLDLVTAEPEGEAVVAAGVDADSSHIDGILARTVDGHGIAVAARVVHDDDAGSELQGCTGLLGGDGFLALDPHGLAVGTHDGHTHAGGAHADVAVHDFAGLLDHLHLLAGVVVVLEDVDVGNDVVGQLVLEVPHGQFFLADGDFEPGRWLPARS